MFACAHSLFSFTSDVNFMPLLLFSVLTEQSFSFFEPRGQGDTRMPVLSHPLFFLSLSFSVWSESGSAASPSRECIWR